jgi:minor extracellular serine protease Vpr
MNLTAAASTLSPTAQHSAMPPKLERWWFVLYAGVFCALSSPINAEPQSNAEARVDQAWATYGVSGKGVIVAPIDRGIDWRHADFRNADGSTRIEAIFDLTDDTGANAAGNSYGKGTLYTRTQINAALSGGTALATRDTVGHGTATAGGAAGNGSTVAGKYRGPAYEATLVVVKFVTEGAAARGAIAAEAPFYDPARLPLAFRFIKDTAARLGMPAVMHMNFGSVTGPMDGTGIEAEAIDAAVGSGKPGIVAVTGTSDDGGSANYAEGRVAQGATVDLQIEKSAANASSNLRVWLWYSGADQFDVALITPLGTFGPYPAPAANGSDNKNVGGANYFHLGGSLNSNGKRYILADISGGAGTYILRMTGRVVASGVFQGSLNPSRTVGPASTGNKFLSFVQPGHTVWSAAAAKNNIAPNNYVYKAGTGGTVGELWEGSGIGPTYDGRIGVDFSAPGEGSVAPVAADSYFASTGSGPSDGGGKYTFFGAVSGASPIAVGVIALMLQRNPTLDAVQVRDILRGSARADSATGAVPNTRWGYGKLDALAAVGATTTPVAAVTVVEYYNAALDAYFITGRANEQAIINTVAGFQRTGGSINAVSAASASNAQVPICRYYINTTTPFTSSHFYGPRDTDCAAIAAANLAGFTNEGLDFAITLPTAGACPASAPFSVYRSFRAAASGKTSNHRFSTSLARYNEMTAKGWSPEGIVFCAASGTAATQ